MNRRTLAIAILIPFTLLTLYAVSQVGFIGIFEITCTARRAGRSSPTW